jgi:cell division protein FtsI/penicillin-binding protein 2
MVFMKSMQSFFSKKQRTVVLFSILLLLLLLFLCAACSRATASHVVERFSAEMEQMDFKKAYSYLWPRADIVSEEVFVSSFEYIKNTLGITHIALEEPKIIEVEENEQLLFSFTMVYEKEDTFRIETPLELFIVKENGAYQIAFQNDLMLPDFTPGIYEDESKASGSKIAQVKVTGHRGDILTADRKVVATTDYSDTVMLEVRDDLDVNTSINALCSVLDITKDSEIVDIRKRYESAKAYEYGTSMAKVLPKGSIDEALRDQLLAIDGVFIDTDSVTPQRYYPYGNVYAHVIGYASTPSEEELAALEKEGYADALVCGKTGIEKEYDRYLQPKSGYRINLYAPDGAYVSTLYEEAPQNGCDIILTVDSYLQQKATYQMAGKLQSFETGACIVMNPTTGFVEAMVSAPTFDPNIFSFPVSDEVYQSLISEENGSPLFNRATTGLYAPGSIIKPFSVTPALESGIVTQYTVFPYSVSNDRWTPPGTWYWDPVTRVSTPDGPLDLDRAIRFSDNIYFSWVALQLGEEAFMDYMTHIGLDGNAVSFDLPVAKPNLLNRDAEINFNDDGTMTRKMLSDMAFGHGNELVTPIQAASMYTVFQNGGNMLNPILVWKIEEPKEDGTYETVFEAEQSYFVIGAMRKDTIDILTYSLKNVVASGTAQSLQTPGLTIAAKTGTALKGDNKNKQIAWICAWYQDMEEQRLVVTVIESNQGESTARHAITKALLQPE